MSVKSVVLEKIDDNDDENHAQFNHRRRRKDGIQQAMSFNAEKSNCWSYNIPSGPTCSGPTCSGPTSSGLTSPGLTSSGLTSILTSSGPPCSAPTCSGPTCSSPTCSGRSLNGEIQSQSESVDGQRPSSRLFRSAACLIMTFGATFVLEFALTDIGLTLQRPMLVAMQLFCFVFLFYSVAVYLQSVWMNEIVFAVFCVCIAVEFLVGYVATQDLFNTTFVQPLLTLVLLLSVGGVSMFLSLDILHCALLMTGISIVRLLACSTISDLPLRLKPVLAYCSGAVGIVAAHYRVVAMQSVSVNCLDLSNKQQKETYAEADETTLRNSHHHAKPRRISLPNLARKHTVASATESTLLMKADGLLKDLVVDPAVPRHIVRVLNAIMSLLKQSIPPVTTATAARRSKSIPHVSLWSTGSGMTAARSFSDLPYSDLPYADDYIHFYSNKGLHRSAQSISLNRCSSSFGIWTTTTSATGMPSLESELLGRSKFPMYGESGCFGRAGGNWTIGGDDKTENHHAGDVWLGDRRSSGEKDSAEMPESPESGESDGARTKSSLGEDQDRLRRSGRSGLHGILHKHQTMCSENSKNGDRELFSISDELANSSLLGIKQLRKWDYPIFELAAKAPDTVLCRVAYKIFKHLGFFELFSIPVQEFLNYFHALELGYHNNPYHNRIHATDVLHAVFYMTTRSLAGFIKCNPVDAYKNFQSEQDVDYNSAAKVETALDGGMDDCMRANFLPLELMALYTAAAMHDYDHPGRTNAFLVSTCNPLAVLYNNRSVLENHHASSGWRLLLSSQRYAWLVNLSNVQFKRFRFLVIEGILATDLARHFDLLAEFNAKVNEDDAPGVDWLLETDRQMVSNMLIKMADINGPCKPRDLHKQWTYRISEEFYEQGDEEEALCLTISPYMNRHQPQLAKLQESFINHLVAPLCNSLSSAGLLPAMAMQAKDQESSASNDETLDEDSSLIFICPMVQNMEENHGMWVKIIEEETMEKSIALTGNTTCEMEPSAVEYNIPSDPMPANEDSDAV